MLAFGQFFLWPFKLGQFNTFICTCIACVMQQTICSCNTNIATIKKKQRRNVQQWQTFLLAIQTLGDFLHSPTTYIAAGAALFSKHFCISTSLHLRFLYKLLAMPWSFSIARCLLLPRSISSLSTYFSVCFLLLKFYFIFLALQNGISYLHLLAFRWCDYFQITAKIGYIQ